MKESNKHTLTRVLKFSIVVNILLGLILAAVISIKYFTKNITSDLLSSQSSGITSVIDAKNDSVCISCDYLGRTITANDTLYDKIVTTDCGQRLCCFRDLVIKNFINAVSQSNKDRAGIIDRPLWKSFDWWRKRRQASHLYLDKENPFTDDGKLRWKKQDSYGTAFTNGVKLINGSHIEIQKEGYYFIYVAVSFNHESQDKVEMFYQTLIKRHPLLPRTGDTVLVMNKYGGSRDSDKHHSNYLAGIHHLQRGYQIGSVLSDGARNFVDRSSSVANYFGISPV